MSYPLHLGGDRVLAFRVRGRIFLIGMILLFLSTENTIDCVAIRGRRPLQPDELQQLQGLATSFDPPPPGYSMPTFSGAQVTDFDYNGIGPAEPENACLGGSIFREVCEVENDVGGAKEQCARSLCDPLCLRMTWECKAVSKSNDESFVSFAKMVENIEYTRAICAHVKAYACTEIMKCCKKDDPFVYEWVEGMASEEDGIHTLVPYPECDHDVENEPLSTILCSSCQKEFALETFQPIANACDNLGSTPGGVPDYEENPGPTSGNWVANPNKMDKMWKKMPQVPLWVPEYADGKRKSLRERCEMFQQQFKQGGWEAKILNKITPEKTCKCMGCCNVALGEEKCDFR